MKKTSEQANMSMVEKSSYVCSTTEFKQETTVDDGQQKIKSEKVVEFATFDGATKRQAEILEQLKESGKITLTVFEKFAKTTRATGAYKAKILMY